ncbi:hypothetical protein CBOM_05936 [Ceraceosorus bombacis]|uniref:Uncharacterized protein n=1 Tax=Ceraceosorus bombacis TaxID=401625 RepID=A0A0P1BI76_9BASI|nr:hypothetical protein CBOM_05936 [Ceraceosorus bombacis]
MARFALSLAAILAYAAAVNAQARQNATGDAEAAQAPNRGRPQRDWTPWTPKPEYTLESMPDQYMGRNRSGNNVDQYGWNVCPSDTWNQESRCQTAWLNSASDFCLWGPPNGGTVGATEREAVAFCTRPSHGTRLIPDGTLTSVHWVQTDRYVQVTGTGDFTSFGIPEGDDGGEMDSHGMDDLSNPVGGVVFTTANPATNGRPFFVQEWTNFMSWNQYCFRACWGNDAGARCQHIYDVLGCQWNIPASYEPNEWDSAVPSAAPNRPNTSGTSNANTSGGNSGANSNAAISVLLIATVGAFAAGAVLV